MLPVYEHEMCAGSFMWDVMHELGNTYAFYVLWDRAVITSDANIIKVSDYYLKTMSKVAS